MKYKIINIELGGFNCLLKIKGVKCEFEITFNTLENKDEYTKPLEENKVQYTVLEKSGDQHEIDKIIHQMCIDNPRLTDI